MENNQYQYVHTFHFPYIVNTTKFIETNQIIIIKYLIFLI
jgi:hypothetical protein